MPRPETLIPANSNGTTKGLIEAATPGYTMRLGAGTHDLGNAVVHTPANDVYVIGDPGAVITSTADSNALGEIFRPGAYAADFSVVGTNDAVYQVPVGFGFLTAVDSAVSFIERLGMMADTDCFYLQTSPTGSARVVVKDCSARSRYDLAVAYGSGNNNGLARDLFLINNDFRSAGPSLAAPGDGRARGIVASDFRVSVFGGYYRAGGSSTVNTAVESSNELLLPTLVELVGVTLEAFGTNAVATRRLDFLGATSPTGGDITFANMEQVSATLWRPTKKIVWGGQGSFRSGHAA